MNFGLPPGNWRYDPTKRIQVWVPLDPEADIADAFDETPEPTESDPKKSSTCIDCPRKVRPASLRCQPCNIAHFRSDNPRPPVINPLRLNEPIDEQRVQMVLDGTVTRCSRPERLEVLARWSHLGRSDQELVKLTGWNVPRDRKYIASLNEKDAA